MMAVFLKYFYPRSPCGERLGGDVRQVNRVSISIHALLAESDGFPGALRTTEYQFLSTLSLRRATAASITPAPSRRNFYPRSPCGERHPQRILLPSALQFLSTLSLRRATRYSFGYFGCNRYFYPRSPCGERHKNECTSLAPKPFLSTLSLRRATVTPI